MIIFHQAVELVEGIIQDARLRARCSTIRGSNDPLLYFANFTLLIIANKEAHIMKREIINRAFDRMEKFYAERPERTNPMPFYDSTLREAWTKTISEFEVEDFDCDFDSQAWFLEEEEYQAAVAIFDRREELYNNLFDKFGDYYDELEQEEESNEDNTMENL